MPESSTLGNATDLSSFQSDNQWMLQTSSKVAPEPKFSRAVLAHCWYWRDLSGLFWSIDDDRVCGQICHSADDSASPSFPLDPTRLLPTGYVGARGRLTYSVSMQEIVNGFLLAPRHLSPVICALGINKQVTDETKSENSISIPKRIGGVKWALQRRQLEDV